MHNVSPARFCGWCNGSVPEDARPPALAADGTYVGPIARAVRTTYAAPAQWDAWTVDGVYLYLRHRHGRGRVEIHRDPNPETWTRVEPFATFEGELDYGESGDPEQQDLAELVDFVRQAGLTLAPGVVVEVGSPTTWAIEFRPDGPPIVRPVGP